MMARPISDEELLSGSGRQEPEDMAWLAAMAASSPDQPERAPAEVDPRQRVRELVSQRKPEASGPGDAESAYTSGNDAPGDGGNRWLLALASAIAGQDFAGQRDARRQKYQEGLQQARATDTAARSSRQPVDAATAEMLTMTGMSPESAAATRQDSPALKLSNNLGMIGTRQRGQDMTAQQKAEHEENLLALAGINNTSREGIADKRVTSQEGIAGGRNETAIKVAGMRGKKGGSGAPKTPEQKAAQEAQKLAGDAALLAAHANVTKEQAEAFLAGGEVAVPPDRLEALKIGKGLLDGGSLDRGKASLNTFNREGANPDKVATTNQIKASDPKVITPIRNELLEQQSSITAAINGWKSMSPRARDLFVKTGGGDPSMLANAVKSGLMSPQEQSAAGAIWALANTQIKKFAGSAVTGSEWGRQAKDIGLADNNADIFNSPQRMGDWLQKAANVYRRVKKSYEVSYPDLWKGMQDE